MAFSGYSVYCSSKSLSHFPYQYKGNKRDISSDVSSPGREENRDTIVQQEQPLKMGPKSWTCSTKLGK